MTTNNVQIRVLIVILFFLFPFSVSVYGASNGKKIKVVFRYDDYSNVSSTDLEIKLIEVFQKYNAPCTFGVIPYESVSDVNDASMRDDVPLTKIKSNILKNSINANIIEVALHGYSHKNTYKGKKHYKSEFLGLDYDSQKKRITKGKNYLEEMLDIRVTTFIPPWNTFDLNTIIVLEELGFKCILPGQYGDIKESSKIKILPTSCNLLNLRDAIESARHVPDAQPVIVVLFHEYDFFEINREKGKFSYQNFFELMEWTTSQKDVHVLSIEQATKEIDDLSARRFLNYISYRNSLTHLPPFLNIATNGIYLQSKASYNFKVKYRALTTLFYLALLIASITIAFFGGIIVFQKSILLSSICKYCVPAIMILAIIYSLQNLVISNKEAMVIVLILGGNIGLLICTLKLKARGQFK